MEIGHKKLITIILFMLYRRKVWAISPGLLADFLRGKAMCVQKSVVL